MTNLGKIILGLIILAIIAGGYLYFFRTPVQAPAAPAEAPAAMPVPSPAPTPAPTPSPSAAAKAAPKVTVKMLPDAFSPQTLAIKVGTTVTFVNNDKVDRWPISNLETTAPLCPGFDSKQSIKPGGSYHFTFTIAKFCYYHDHLNPAIKAVIVVNPK